MYNLRPLIVGLFLSENGLLHAVSEDNRYDELARQNNQAWRRCNDTSRISRSAQPLTTCSDSARIASSTILNVDICILVTY